MLDCLELVPRPVGRLAKRRSLRAESAMRTEPRTSKDLYVATQRGAWRQVSAANLPRSVLQAIRDQEHWLVGREVPSETDLHEDLLLGVGFAPGRPDERGLAAIRSSICRLLKDYKDLARTAEASAVLRQLEGILSSMPGPDDNTAHQSFVERARRLDQQNSTAAALDLVYDQIDEMMIGGRFIEIDEILTSTVTDNLSVTILLGLLTATLPAKNRLAKRAEFFERVERTLRDRGSLEAGLLVGLD